MYYPTLQADAQQQIKQIGEADLVIGVPSHQNPHVAANVAKTALAGVRFHYPRLRTVLINVDAGKNPQSQQAVLAQVLPNGHNRRVVCGRYHGPLGPGSAAAALLDAALALDAKAVIVLDSHVNSISPDWIAGLAHLVLENKADLVFPRYRQWLLPEAALNDLIVYPLFRALWGKCARQPMASDFAISPQLATAVLDEDIWGTTAATFGLMPWLATYATVNDWRVAQTALSEKQLPDDDYFSAGTAAQPGARFRRQFHDILSQMFGLMARYCHTWQNVNQFFAWPTLTRFAAATPPTVAPVVDVTPLLDELALGWIQYRRLWLNMLQPDNLAQLEALAALSPDYFYFPADLWARIVFDFAVSFNFAEFDPAQIVEAMLPLYYGRLAAFWQEVAGLAPVGREGTVAAQAVEFEETRPYLKQQWQANSPRPYLPGINNRSFKVE